VDATKAFVPLPLFKKSIDPLRGAPCRLEERDVVLVYDVEWTVRDAADLAEQVHKATEPARSTTHLRQIGLGRQAYHDQHNGFPPPAITGPDGEPLLSWRVAVLPYLEYGDLYNQFHLNERWDSPHNIKLLDKMPAVYASSSAVRPADRGGKGP